MANGKTRNRATAQELADPEPLRKDFFYHGTILRLSPRKKLGSVRTSSGRELSFSYELVDMFGPVTNPRELREGLVVGYDMSWTSHGLKVTKIKTYRRGGDGRPVTGDAETVDVMPEKPLEPSERKQGEGEDLK